MAKRGLSGQLNLFDFWGDTNPEDSIVEMVSLVPEESEQGEEPKVEMVSLMPEEEPKERAPERAEEVPEIAEESGLTEAVQEMQKKTLPKEEFPETPIESRMAEKLQDIPETQEFPEENELPKESNNEQAPVMHKEKKDKNGNVLSEISYLNYNKVFIRNSKYQQGKLFEFENSKEAVDFYITEMMKLTGEDSWDQE